MASWQARIWWPKSIRAGLQLSSALAIAAGYGLLWGVFRTSSSDILHERHADAIERAAREVQKLSISKPPTPEEQQKARQLLEEISSNHHLFWIHPEENHGDTIFPPRRIKSKPFDAPGLLGRAETIAEEKKARMDHTTHSKRSISVHSQEFKNGGQHFHSAQAEINVKGAAWDLYLLQDFTLERDQQDHIDRLILIAALISTAAGMTWNEFGIRKSLKPLQKLSQEVLSIPDNILEARDLATSNRPPELRGLVASFNSLQQKLKASIQKQTELVSAMSHELLTPVTLIQGHLARLVRKNPSLSASIKTPLSTISSQTSRLYRLVHLLLDLSRQGTGRSSIRLEPIAIIELADKVSALINSESTGLITLEDDICDPSSCLKADRQRLFHVFEELVDHALLHGNIEAGSPASFKCEQIDKHMRIHLLIPTYPVNSANLIQSKNNYLRQDSNAIVDGGGLSLVLIQTLLSSMHSDLIFLDDPQGGIDFYFDLPLTD